MPTYSIGVDVGSNGAVTILDKDRLFLPEYLALRKPHDIRQLYQMLSSTAVEGTHFLINIEKVNGSVMMSPTDIFKFGINYGVSLHILFGLKNFLITRGATCDGIRVITPSGWQNRVRETPADVFDFGTKQKKSYEQRKEEWFQLAKKILAEAYPTAAPMCKYAADSFLIAHAGFACASLTKEKSAMLYKSEDDYYDIN